jgi:RAB protein geranylgeranyltransferase component A
MIKMGKKINEKENLIHNAFAKFEEANERIYALEKRVKMAEDKNEHLASKSVEETTPNSSVSCSLCDIIFKSESELEKHTE